MIALVETGILDSRRQASSDAGLTSILAHSGASEDACSTGFLRRWLAHPGRIRAHLRMLAPRVFFVGGWRIRAHLRMLAPRGMLAPRVFLRFVCSKKNRSVGRHSPPNRCRKAEEQQAVVRKQKAGASHERWGRPQPETRRSCPRATGRPCRGTTLRHTYFRSTNPRPSARDIYPHSNPPTTPTHCLPNPTPLRRWPRPGTSAPALSASSRSLLCWPAPGQSRRCPRGTNLYQTSHQPFPQHDENCRQTNYFFQTKHQPSPQNGGSWRG